MGRNRSLIERLKHLQQKGVQNWKLAQKYHVLIPFAGLYQLASYVSDGVISRDSFLMIYDKRLREEAKKKKELYAMLEIK